MPPFRDLTGQQFGRLKAIRLAGRTAAGQAMWECLCQCGKTTTVYGVSLTRGKSQSCDCLRLERVKAAATKHGHAQRSFHQTGTYTSWCSMLARCQNPNRERYPNWGGRGITVCERWQGEHGFETSLLIWDHAQRARRWTASRTMTATMSRVTVNGPPRRSSKQIHIPKGRAYDTRHLRHHPTYFGWASCGLRNGRG